MLILIVAMYMYLRYACNKVATVAIQLELGSARVGRNGSSSL